MQVPSDYRLAGGMMLAAGALDALVAFGMFVALGVVCIGFAWIVPFAVAVGEMVVGALALLGVPMRFARTAAIAGIVNAAVLFDVPAVALQVVALVWLNQAASVAYVALRPPPRGEGPSG